MMNEKTGGLGETNVSALSNYGFASFLQLKGNSWRRSKDWGKLRNWDYGCGQHVEQACVMCIETILQLQSSSAPLSVKMGIVWTINLILVLGNVDNKLFLVENVICKMTTLSKSKMNFLGSHGSHADTSILWSSHQPQVLEISFHFSLTNIFRYYDWICLR